MKARTFFALLGRRTVWYRPNHGEIDLNARWRSLSRPEGSIRNQTTAIRTDYTVFREIARARRTL